MRIAILSDIHDNVWNLAAALDASKALDALICCGDLCSPFVVHQIARGFSKPIHIVFGNNDGDQFRITANAQKHEHVRIHGELFRGEFAGRRIAATHYDNIGRSITKSGEFDVVCYGHNHVFDVSRDGPTMAINPGALMGSTFGPDGSRTDVIPTYVVYDSVSDTATGFEIISPARQQFEVRPRALANSPLGV